VWSFVPTGAVAQPAPGQRFRVKVANTGMAPS
jgi:hypothetical protein